MPSVLEARHLIKTFGRGKRLVRAVQDVSFELQPGETVGLIGESGSGKSTLARLLVGLLTADAGELRLHGKPYRDYLSDRKAFAREVQMIFQNPYDVFDRRFTIGELLARPLKIHGLVRSQAAAREKILESLEQVAISPAEDFIARYPGELSGGQLQRIAILRAMLLEPRLLVADEAVSSLDVSVRAEVLNLILKLKQTHDMAILFISHDLDTTAYIADRIMVMYHGEIIENKSTEDIIEHPEHAYTKALLGKSLVTPDNMPQGLL